MKLTSLLLNALLVLWLSLASAPLHASLLIDTELPPNFNPNTCEQDKLDPKNLYRLDYQGISCEGLSEKYRWLLLQQAALDARNDLFEHSQNPNAPESLQRTQRALTAMATLARRVANDYKRPEKERTDWVGDFLNHTQKRFADRQWLVPNTLPEIFDLLQARLSKAYVSPEDQGAIIVEAQAGAAGLFQLSQEVTRVQVGAVEMYAYRGRYEAEQKEQARVLAEKDSYVANVEARASKFRGIGTMIFGSLLIAGVAVFLVRRFMPSTRSCWIAWAAGSLGLFLASLGAGAIQLVTGISTPFAFAMMFLFFGVIYVAFRDRLRSAFPDIEILQSHGSAGWSNIASAINAGRIFGRGMVSADSHGFALGRVPQASTELDPRLRYMGHVLTCAPTGSGKGIGAVIPTLLEYPGSALVLDIKGENYAVTARARRALGHTVHLVDPFGSTGAKASSFNPLDMLDLSDPDVVGQSSAIIEMLVVSSSTQDDNSAHFNDSAKDLLKGLLVYVANAGAPAKRNLGELRRLLTLPLASDKENPRESLMDHLADMSADTEIAFGIPARCANGFLSKDSKEASGVHSTALRHTAWLDDPRIVECLSRSDFDLADLKRKPMTIFVVMPPDKLAAQVRFMRVLVGAALSAITATTIKPQFNVLFLLDEFAQLGRMQAIEDAISSVRGYGARFWLFVQDLSQLKGVYPKWQTFLANTAKQFYGTADFDTAKYVSDMLGQRTIEFATRGDSSNASAQGLSSGSSNSHQVSARSLLTPDEVMRLGAAKPIVLIQGERPYLLQRMNYLADAEFIGLADPNPFHS